MPYDVLFIYLFVLRQHLDLELWPARYSLCSLGWPQACGVLTLASAGIIVWYQVSPYPAYTSHSAGDFSK